MGAAGGSFANAFANTLIHGGQVMAHIQNQREAVLFLFDKHNEPAQH